MSGTTPENVKSLSLKNDYESLPKPCMLFLLPYHQLIFCIYAVVTLKYAILNKEQWFYRVVLYDKHY